MAQSESWAAKVAQLDDMIDDAAVDEAESDWWMLPEPVLLQTLWLLPIKDLLSICQTCRRWHEIASDELLWKNKFQRHFRVLPNIQLKPDASSWKAEYKRLTCDIPLVQTQRLEGHGHQVLHVSFSHNGEMFATCSKDGYVIIWNAAHPCTERYAHNMKQFSWKYTQYSQFNQSDTLLLVSGVHFGSPHSTSGEIAVFTVSSGDSGESHLRCRVMNRPYDIFGTWFSDQYLISGDMHWLAHLVSTSVLWLNKANQEIDSEHVPIMNQLYKFYNRNASSVRAIMIAKCPWLTEDNDPLALQAANASETVEQMEQDPSSNSAGNPLSHSAAVRRPDGVAAAESFNNEFLQAMMGEQAPYGASNSSHAATIRYAAEYRREVLASRAAAISDSDSACSSTDEDEANMDVVDATAVATEDDDDMENAVPRYLIFSTGSKTYTPHQVGIKRIRHVNFPKKLDPGPTLKERIAAKKAADQQTEPRADPDWWNYTAVADRFDKVDKVIDLHGHIIGMALSPDHRYLYVNTRPWPQDYVITNALEPPPIAQEIDIHVIDLMTLKHVGNMLRAHKAYTPSTECFFIFLDVCDDYVASGAEDKHAYLWERYYGISLAKFQHTDVVNSVAFNPRDSEMLVSTSDDNSIKIWRSRRKAKALNVEATENPQATELKQKTLV